MQHAGLITQHGPSFGNVWPRQPGGPWGWLAMLPGKGSSGSLKGRSGALPGSEPVELQLPLPGRSMPHSQDAPAGGPSINYQSITHFQHCAGCVQGVFGFCLSMNPYPIGGPCAPASASPPHLIWLPPQLQGSDLTAATVMTQQWACWACPGCHSQRTVQRSREHSPSQQRLLWTPCALAAQRMPRVLSAPSPNCCRAQPSVRKFPGLHCRY